jgi:hypothetical protein
MGAQHVDQRVVGGRGERVGRPRPRRASCCSSSAVYMDITKFRDGAECASSSTRPAWWWSFCARRHATEHQTGCRGTSLGSGDELHTPCNGLEPVDACSSPPLVWMVLFTHADSDTRRGLGGSPRVAWDRKHLEASPQLAVPQQTSLVSHVVVDVSRTRSQRSGTAERKFFGPLCIRDIASHDRRMLLPASRYLNAQVPATAMLHCPPYSRRPGRTAGGTS